MPADRLHNNPFPGILPAIDHDPAADRCVIIAGPCSAESRDQIIGTALQLKECGVDAFRAGVWKPRTHPGGFEGMGTQALEWLAEAKMLTGLPVATEIASATHLYEALDAGIDILWLGARTTTNPFLVQEIAEAAQRWCEENSKDISQLRFMIKNPANQDLELWIGAIQRIYNVGIRRITAIHRGFSVYGDTFYRNSPCWDIPMELRRRVGRDMQILSDPSHIGGRSELVEPIARQALERGFDGLIIESHPQPATALSDSRQQITPAELKEIISRLEYPGHNCNSDQELTALRCEIDRIDDQLMELISRRMQVAREIGRYKKEHGMTVVQPDRYDSLIQRHVTEAEARGVSGEFIRELLSVIHEESVRQQL